MDFLVISKNKLKIKMNKRELKRYSLNAPEEEYNSREVRAALWRVLDVAYKECGFSISGERMLVQIYCTDAGCEIFVTKLGRLGASAERNIARSGSVTMLSSRSNLYRFSDVSTLLSALNHIPMDARDECQLAYLSDENTCHLLVEERAGATPIGDLTVLSEFATEVPLAMLTHLREHATSVPAKALFSIID